MDTLASPPSSASGQQSGKSSEKGPETEKEKEECRVCRCGTEFGPLFYPCKCKGSIRYVHESCLLEWLSVTQGRSCEVCKAEFQFTLLYHNDTPKRLSKLEVVRGTLMIGLRNIPTLFRYLSVGLIWLVVFPVSVQNTHELFFATTLEQVKDALFVYNMKMNELFNKCMHGFLLETIIVCVFLAITTMQESINKLRNLHRTHFLDTARDTDQHDLICEEGKREEYDIAQLEDFDDDNEAKKKELEKEEEEGENNEDAEDTGPIPGAVGNIVFEDDNDIDIDLGLEDDDDDAEVNNGNDFAALDVMLGLRGGNFIVGVRNMIFITLANMVFLVIFQLIPFYIGRFVHPNFLSHLELTSQVKHLGSVLLSPFYNVTGFLNMTTESTRDNLGAMPSIYNDLKESLYMGYGYPAQQCDNMASAMSSQLDGYKYPLGAKLKQVFEDLDQTYERLHMMQQEIQEAGTWYAMLVGYVAIIACISVYILCTNLYGLLYRLLKRTKHRTYNPDNHIAILTTYFVHIYTNLYNGVKLGSIYLVEFVLLGQAIGWVIHIGSLGIFGETLKDMPTHLHMCGTMPQLCLGIHWLVGTLTLSAANLFLTALKKVVRPRYSTLFSVTRLRNRLWNMVMRIRIILGYSKVPLDDSHLSEGSLRNKQGKSLHECLEYSFLLLAVSIPACVLLMVIPIQLIELAFPSTFPLKLGGNLRNSEVVNAAVVSIDLFLMHTVVPYTLDTIKLGLLLAWFIRMMVEFFAYRLDLHGCILRYTNHFSDMEGLITVNTKAEPVVHISKLLERSSTDAKNLNQKRSECSNVVKNDFESSCLNDFDELKKLPVGSRVNLLCFVVGSRPLFNRTKENGQYHRNSRLFNQGMNLTSRKSPVLALADTTGYAASVFLSDELDTCCDSLNSTAELGEHINSSLFDSVTSFCESLKHTNVYDVLINEGLSVSKVSCSSHESKQNFSLENWISFMNILCEIDCRNTENRSLVKSYLNYYAPTGWGRVFDDDICRALTTLNAIWEKSNETECIPVAVEDVLISDIQGRSFVLDAQSKCVIYPQLDGIEQKLSVFNDQVKRTSGELYIYMYKPCYVTLRLVILLLAYFLTSMMLCMLIMATPLLLGREIFHVALLPLEHDLYHWSVGCFMIWSLAYFTSWSVRNTYTRGFRDVVNLCREWIVKKMKLLFCVALMFIVIPIFCGILFDRIVMIPYRYNRGEAHGVSIQQNWVVGLALCKFLSRLIILGVFGETPWIQKVEALQDIRGLERQWLIHEVAYPILLQLGIRLIIPYTFSRLVSLFIDENLAEVVLRYSFPVFSSLLLLKDCLYILIAYLDRLHDTVRDQRYIIGRKLQNLKL